MNITDDKIKKILRKRRGRRPRGDCPSEEALAAYVEDKLAPDDQDKVTGHVVRCQSCLTSVKVLRKILLESEREDMVRIPGAALKRAKRLDPASKSIIEVVIRFVKGAAEVVKMSGDAVGGLIPATESVRGKGRVVSETLVTFTKEFNPYFAEVDVEKIKPDQGEITVKLMEKESSRPARGVRVSLFDKDVEMESAMVSEGAAVFENLAFGQYRLEITKVGEPIGRITLEMKGDGK